MILGLNNSCDIGSLRRDLVQHCRDYSINVLKRKENEGEENKEGINELFRAYICPNPGSSSNMGSKK